MGICIPGGTHMEGGTGFMLRYLLEMRDIFGESKTVKLFMLKIGVQFYPILRAKGLGLHAPIGIVVEDEEMTEWIAAKLCGFAEPMIISLSVKTSDFKKKVAATEYEFLAIFCKSSHINNWKNISALNDLMISRSIEHKKFEKLPMIFFVGGIPPEISEFLAGKIVFEGKAKRGKVKSQQELTRYLLELFVDYWPTIENKLDEILCEASLEIPFLSACMEISRILIQPKVKADKDQSIVRRLGMYVDAMEKEWIIKD